MKQWEGFQHGVNLGGWISQFTAYDPVHFETFITEKDVADVAAMGFDHVRVPVDYNVLEDEAGHILESGFGYLENCRRWCGTHRLRMLIDLHECYGYSFDPLKKGMDRRRFFYDEALQARFLALWTELARRFGAYPAQVAFEPLNEVVLPDVAEAWNGLVRRFIETVRPLAPETWLVIGGVCYNHVTSVALLDPPYDGKIVYNFHCYEPHIFTHQGAYWEERMPSGFRTGYPETPETYRRLSREILGADGLYAADADFVRVTINGEYWGVYLLADHARWIEGDFIPYLLASAFAVLYAELMARLRKCPTTLFVIPAILPLVPGGSLYYAMSYAVRGQMGAAGQYGLRALKLGLAIAAGISIMVALREIRARR